MTPAQEHVCDGQVGRAFGLCNAYCEANDCDSDEANAAPRACDELKARWYAATDGDPIPCEPVNGCACSAALLSCGWFDGSVQITDQCNDVGNVIEYQEARGDDGQVDCVFAVREERLDDRVIFTCVVIIPDVVGIAHTISREGAHVCALNYTEPLNFDACWHEDGIE